MEALESLFDETRPPVPPDQLLTIYQAAALLQVTDKHLRNLVRDRRIPFLRVGRLLRFEREPMLDAFRGLSDPWGKGA